MTMGLVYVISLCAGTILFANYACGYVVVYPRPSGIQPSDEFSVLLHQNFTSHHGDSHTYYYTYHSFTYKNSADHRVSDSPKVHPNRSVSWTSFSFYQTGNPVTVEVRTQKDFQNCLIRPRHYGIRCRRTGTKTARFEVSSFNKTMSVEFDYDYGSNKADITDKLLIFVDPLESDNVPSASNHSVLYYGSGVHNLEGQKVINESITEIYLAPGAYVYGGFRTSGSQSVKIHGRGVISGEKWPWHDSHFPWAAIEMDNGSSHTIEGVVILDPTKYFVRALGDHNTVRNVKTLGAWMYNSDGVALGTNGLIENSFIMANDDSIKVYNDNLTVRRVVVWQCQNGAVFQLGWWSERHLHHVRISDVDVIHTDWCTFKGDHCRLSDNNAVLDLAGHTLHFDINDVELKNVRIEGSCPRIIYFPVAHNASGRVSNMRLVNWSTDSQPTEDYLHNSITTNLNTRLINWNFENFLVGGHCLSNAKHADFAVSIGSSSSIHFSCAAGPIVG